jgi:hypothetical protein
MPKNIRRGAGSSLICINRLWRVLSPCTGVAVLTLRGVFAMDSTALAYVRFTPNSDIKREIWDVRFGPKSGHK